MPTWDPYWRGYLQDSNCSLRNHVAEPSKWKAHYVGKRILPAHSSQWTAMSTWLPAGLWPRSSTAVSSLRSILLANFTVRWMRAVSILESESNVNLCCSKYLNSTFRCWRDSCQKRPGFGRNLHRNETECEGAHGNIPAFQGPIAGDFVKRKKIRGPQEERKTKLESALTQYVAYRTYRVTEELSGSRR